MESPGELPPPASGWRRWLEENGGLFFLYARQQTRGEEDARDVVQDALVEAWTRSGGVTPDKAMVLATIRRRAIDLGRSIDRRRSREENFWSEVATWFESDFGEGDTRDYLRSAIGQLGESQREVLILRIWGELSFEVIAQLIEVPPGTAKSRYRHALTRLRGVLSELQP